MKSVRSSYSDVTYIPLASDTDVPISFLSASYHLPIRFLCRWTDEARQEARGSARRQGATSRPDEARKQ